MPSALRNDLPDWLPSLSYEVLTDAAEALEDVQWLLVGALARDYAFRDSDDLKTLRATMDVDLAALTQTWSEFDDIVNRLCDSGAFGRTAMAHRLAHVNGQLMDFLPFGGVERNHHVAWPPNGEPEMNMMGFRDVLEISPCVSLLGGIDVRIAPAPAVAFLKMVAWHDNPDIRERDVEDITSFVKGYITEIVGWDNAFDAYNSVMSADDFDLEEAGAYILGIEMSRLLSENIRAQLIALTREIADIDSKFAELLGGYLNTSHDHSVRICDRLRRGLQEEPLEGRCA